MTLFITRLFLAVIPLLWYSCDDRHGLTPPSGGKLYEVLVVGDRDNIVKTALMQDTPGLPQSEPQFDVSSIDDDHFGPSVSVSRNIVKVDINPQLYTSVRLKYEKNVWAEPQMVVYVHAPSVRMLKDSIGRVSPTLLQLLNRSEINKNITLLRTKRNIKAEKLVKQMFGVTMWIPMEMTSSKKGKDFLWLSNNSPTTMKNIVIYKDDGNSMGENIKGETDGMHYQHIAATETTDVAFKRIPVCRGLWEMTGDDMGGPFVVRKTQKVYAEGFVFAPGKKKRNAIHELEAALYTAKP